MNRIISFFFLLIAFGSFAQKQENKIIVAVAANMQYPMNALKENFEKQSGVQLEVILGSSGKLTQQILEGAPYDVFISADTKYPFTLWVNKFAADSPKIYAKGLLVLWTMRNDLIPGKDLTILLSNNVKKIAVANPKTAPYGIAAEELMRLYDIYDKVQSKLVFGESITQTNQFITSLSADIGFTAKSVVLSDEMKGKGSWVDLDAKAYQPIEQAAVILRHGWDNNKDASQKFYDYLYSDSAKEIFRKFGYVVE